MAKRSTLQRPISVNGSKLPATLFAALRYSIATIGSYAVGAGWVDPDNLEGIATVILTLATVAYGLWKTNAKQGEAIVMAEAVHDSVAKVK